MADAVAILPAAGQGSRLGRVKQYLELGGVPMLARSAACALACEDVAALVVAVPPGDEARVRALLGAHLPAAALRGRPIEVVAGGAARADSVRAALDAAPHLALAAIHDAARPFATPGLFRRVLAAAREHGAALAALPCADTVKQAGPQGTVEATLDRRSIHLAQTPQAFRRELLLAAYARAGATVSAATDEAQLVEALGHAVHLVAGEKENFKVTDADDLARARALAEAPAAVGFGMDVHAFATGRRCVLGGVEFPGETGLAGHSDADAPVHALMDAILGAAGLGDIGEHFPDTDTAYAGADSIALLREVVRRARAAGYAVLNADLTIAAARPRIGPRREEMRVLLAAALGIATARMNVKATTTEGLGFVGRAEGLAAQAVVLLGRVESP